MKTGTRALTVAFWPCVWMAAAGLATAQRIGDAPGRRVADVPFNAINDVRYDLPVTNGLVLRLDATVIAGLGDGDPVATWHDSSGLGHHATQATPARQPSYRPQAFNGGPCVRFGESGWRLLVTPPVTLGPRTYFVIMEGINPGVGIWHSVILQGVAPYYQIYAPINGTAINFYTGATSSLTTNMHRKLALTITAQTGDLQFYVDGQPALTSANGNSTILNSPFHIGGWAAANYGLNGHLAEILVYDRIVTDAERRAVEQYLGEKWLAW